MGQYFICNYLRQIIKLGYSYKKTYYHPKRDIELRNEFIAKINITKDKLVYLDESGIEDNVCKEYGWTKMLWNKGVLT